MTNLEYIASLIVNNDLIYIDTSALMNVNELTLLVSNIRNLLLAEGKHITVPHEVYIELLRHLKGNDNRKKLLAVQVFDLLYENKNIFFIENTEIKDIEIFKVFADAKLLASLTENKSSYRQLLITNDRKLSHDAYDLNNLESCKGHKIKVCYLNKYGELHKSACTSKLDIPASPEKENTDANVVPNFATPKETETTTHSFNKYVVPAVTLCIGLFLGNYGSKVLKNINI